MTRGQAVIDWASMRQYYAMLYDRFPLDADLSPSSVATYLETAGWTLVVSDDMAQMWELREGHQVQARLRLPIDPTLGDFERRFEEAFMRISQVTGYGVRDLSAKILGTARRPQERR